jgi:hypothetical protein
MNAVEGEAVARQRNSNREWTRMDTNSWERDRLGRRGVRLAPRLRNKDRDREVFGGDAKHGGRDDRAPNGLDFKALASIRVHSRFDARFPDSSGSSRASR